jgi:carbamoyl-phosphate synthase small subunit
MNINIHILRGGTMKAYVHLKNGDTFEGKWVVKTNNEPVSGEIVFFTGMTGYQEVLTDPSYKDQIIVFTYPLIGNYGINLEDFESKRPHVAGVIVYEACMNNNHYQAKYSLSEYLQKWGIPLIEHVDTREVVKQIRNEGSMPALINNDSNKPEAFELLDTEKVSKVSSTHVSTEGHGGDFHVVLMDFGNKKSIQQSLLDRGCKVTTVPYNCSFEEIKKLNPDGILLSNGPGDPKHLKNLLPTIAKVIKAYPTLGICLGHQLAGLALGANTKKLLFGHRGANHPVMDKETKTVFMTSQNHSYYVDEKSLAGTGLQTRFYNLHDSTVEGFYHESYQLLTTQFHPEANPGPSEGEYIFDEFLQLIKENNGSQVAYA